ncbi:hypothetical protein RB594_006878 [Gaeumannomyces avenae]
MWTQIPPSYRHAGPQAPTNCGSADTPQLEQGKRESLKPRPLPGPYAKPAAATAAMFGFFSSLPDMGGEPRRLEARTLEAFADHIKSGDVRRIIVLTGAGISTAAGIPDFRSPGTGLYSNLERLNLPHAEAVFDIEYFREHPEPFYYLAKELYPGNFYPTLSHAFIALLHKKGLLHVDFTQNIDCLERHAGVPDSRIVEAHGSFATQRCIDCRAEFDGDRMRKHVEDGVVPHCDECNGLVKPDIVFFGEPLPAGFRENSHKVVMTDAVIIIGTSLSVYPFAGLADMVPAGVPRLLLNKQRVHRVGDRSDDVVEIGPCDDGVRRLADLLGWRDELEALWRSVVGDKEADRQLGRAAEGPPDLDEEVRKLTEGVETGLKLVETQSAEKKGENEPNAEQNVQTENNAGVVSKHEDQGPGALSAIPVTEDKTGDLTVKTNQADDGSASSSADQNTQPARDDLANTASQHETEAIQVTDSGDQNASTATPSAAAGSESLKENNHPAKEAESAPPKEAKPDTFPYP